ncbi:hypothetical protein HD806DRAFT_508951 [Xylariaceae sp. AK1471]|nr:hypothetical protein HD806DRAFT_508951 [Xylariaceae sp. AK1471]
MIAVAGAIFAQVGISALSLEAVGQVHWTASAFFVASLVLGIISVYASFIVQQELNGLLSNEEVADWCSRPLTEDEVLERAYALSNNPAFRLSDRPLPEHIPFQVSPQSGVNVSARLKREASVLAAIEVASPAGFLGLSLNAFIIGLGIYLGCVYTDDLISQYGRGGSLGILIFFLIASALGTFVYSFPSLLKASETKSGNKTSEQRKHLEQLAAAIARYHTERSTQNTTPSVVS